jgi:hypothetical protein
MKNERAKLTHVWFFIENFVTLKHIAFGYKIFDKDYFDFNYFLTILGFSIYKAYYASEQKTKQVNIYSLHIHIHIHIYNAYIFTFQYFPLFLLTVYYFGVFAPGLFS